MIARLPEAITDSGLLRIAGRSYHLVMTTARIDVHSHLLPGIDDGCPSLAESLACARELVKAGYSHVFCTPHVWPRLPQNNATEIPRLVADLQASLDREKIPLTLLPGGELNLEWSWPILRSANRDNIVSYAMAGRYVLFDFWADEVPDFLLPAIHHLQASRFTPIMAHPERLGLVHRDPALLERLLDLGVLLQCNSYCLADPPGAPTRRVAEELLRRGRYFLLGTDLHNLAGLPIRLEGLRRAVDLVGPEAVDQLTIHNPRKLLPESRVL